MQIQTSPPLHLTYCLNVHPGETWAENLAAIRAHVPAVRRLVGRAGSFGLGLRLSRAAAAELREPAKLAEFRAFLALHDLYVFTINGFPYGRFHGTAVKEDVYRPDWRDPERRDYTLTLADILAALLPDGVSGSISTVPGSYKAWIRTAADVEQMVDNLIAVVRRLAEIREQTGREIVLGLEPEPDCFIETTAETIRFLEGPLAGEGSALLSASAGVSRARAREWLAAHVGVCFDTCHMALQFEDLAAGLSALRAAGVRIAKVQLSAALRVPDAGALDATAAMFRDPGYLHQVKTQGAGGRIESFADLPLAAGRGGTGESRIHFHVPLYFEGSGGGLSTGAALDGAFFRALRAGASGHLEIETYTFHVLPDAVTSLDVDASIAREYEWALGRIEVE